MLIGQNAEAVGQDKMQCMMGALIGLCCGYVGYAVVRYMLRTKIEEHKGIHVS